MKMICCPKCFLTKGIYGTTYIPLNDYKRTFYECMKCGYSWYQEPPKENEIMKEKKINWYKPLRVKATGYSARVLCRDFKNIFGSRYVVAVTNGHGHETTFYCRENDNRIENIPEKREAWFNIHERVPNAITGQFHPTKTSADSYAGQFRIARIKIEYEEGQFDE